MDSLIKERFSVLLSIFLLLILSTASCTDQSSKTEPCSITVDAVEILDTKVNGDKTYYLVYRKSGWSDKVETLDLYDDKPVFDHCSKASIEPVYGDSLEMTKTIAHVFLNIKERKLDIVYEDGQPEKNQKDFLRLELN